MRLLSSRRTRSPYAHLPFFAGWTDAELERMERLVEVVDYEPGDVVAVQGRRTEEFVVLLCGTVDLLDGRTRLGTLGEGDTLGEEGLLSDGHAPAAAVAQTYVRALVLGKRQFYGLLHEAPSMGRRLSLLLAERLAALTA
jgi:CRP-like cAMP-binding protein